MGDRHASDRDAPTPVGCGSIFSQGQAGIAYAWSLPSVAIHV